MLLEFNRESLLGINQAMSDRQPRQFSRSFDIQFIFDLGTGVSYSFIAEREAFSDCGDIGAFG